MATPVREKPITVKQFASLAKLRAEVAGMLERQAKRHQLRVLRPEEWQTVLDQILERPAGQ